MIRLSSKILYCGDGMVFQQNAIDVASFASFIHTTPQLQMEFSLAPLLFLALAGTILLMGAQTQFGESMYLCKGQRVDCCLNGAAIAGCTCVLHTKIFVDVKPVMELVHSFIANKLLGSFVILLVVIICGSFVHIVLPLQLTRCVVPSRTHERNAANLVW